MTHEGGGGGVAAVGTARRCGGLGGDRLGVRGRCRVAVLLLPLLPLLLPPSSIMLGDNCISGARQRRIARRLQRRRRRP